MPLTTQIPNPPRVISIFDNMVVPSQSHHLPRHYPTLKVTHRMHGGEGVEITASHEVMVS
jgi:hypothetical protein